MNLKCDFTLIPSESVKIMREQLNITTQWDIKEKFYLFLKPGYFFCYIFICVGSYLQHGCMHNVALHFLYINDLDIFRFQSFENYVIWPDFQSHDQMGYIPLL